MFSSSFHVKLHSYRIQVLNASPHPAPSVFIAITSDHESKIILHIITIYRHITSSIQSMRL